MTDFFQWLAGGSISSLIFIIVLGLVITGIILIYVVAFFQGREVSFWPPKISEKPKKENKVEGKADKLGRRIDTQSINAPILIRTLFSNDLGKGIKLGGLIKDTSLEVVASDWARFRNAGWVRSGWLYESDRFKEQRSTLSRNGGKMSLTLSGIFGSTSAQITVSSSPAEDITVPHGSTILLCPEN